MNLAFYTDKGPAKPSRATITQLQKELAGDYDELESSHSFIQWLFPIKVSSFPYLQVARLILHSRKWA